MPKAEQNCCEISLEGGLCFEEGILVVIDGAKGLHKAAEDVFGCDPKVSMAQTGECRILPARKPTGHLLTEFRVNSIHLH